MQLYDKDIKILNDYLNKCNLRRLDEKAAWKVSDRETLVLRSEMAYELGGGTNAAVSGLAFTDSESLLGESGVYLSGPDLGEIRADISYARMTFLQLRKTEQMDTESLYALFRRLDYTRYHVFPEGYMMRISAVHEREPVRVSGQAVKNRMDFASVGQSFVQAYLRHPEVKAVKLVFVTKQDADYSFLKDSAGRLEQITESLNKVFKGISMDCSTCGQRELCEEVEGLKELHFQNSLRGK